LGFNNRPNWNSQSSVAGVGLSLGENHFPQTLSPRRVAHRPNNLPLQPQPPPSPGESVAHRPDNLLLQLYSHTRRTTTRLSREQTTATSHTQPRNCMATTTHSYNTHDINNYGMFRLHSRQPPKNGSGTDLALQWGIDWVHGLIGRLSPPDQFSQWCIGM
jgi:hypothetical protein